MPEWEPEVTVDEPLVRALLAEQVPDLAVRELRPFAEGWDNAIWLVNDELAFRFPRRRIAVPGFERELAVLPALARRVPLPIPEPVYVGRPSSRYPWPFFGSRLLPGRELATLPLDGRRAAYGAALGRFLRAFHSPDIAVSLGDGLPIDFNHRADMTVRVPRTRERLAAIGEARLWRVPASADAILEEAAALEPTTDLALVHGDLHVRHVLVDDGGEPSAVIDWGDLCLADPSVDLSLYWSVLDGPGRAAFCDAYGDVPPDRLLRARVLALFLNAALVQYAADLGDATLLAETVAGLERTLVDG